VAWIFSPMIVKGAPDRVVRTYLLLSAG